MLFIAEPSIQQLTLYFQGTYATSLSNSCSPRLPPTLARAHPVTIPRVPLANSFFLRHRLARPDFLGKHATDAEVTARFPRADRKSCELLSSDANVKVCVCGMFGFGKYGILGFLFLYHCHFARTYSFSASYVIARL